VVFGLVPHGSAADSPVLIRRDSHVGTCCCPGGSSAHPRAGHNNDDGQGEHCPHSPRRSVEEGKRVALVSNLVRAQSCKRLQPEAHARKVPRRARFKTPTNAIPPRFHPLLLCPTQTRAFGLEWLPAPPHQKRHSASGSNLLPRDASRSSGAGRGSSGGLSRMMHNLTFIE
jgi:hypothetical protein